MDISFTCQQERWGNSGLKRGMVLGRMVGVGWGVIYLATGKVGEKAVLKEGCFLVGISFTCQQERGGKDGLKRGMVLGGDFMYMSTGKMGKQWS